MNFQTIRRIIGFAVIGGLLLSIIPLNSANAITVSPVRVELSGDPGQEVSGFFKVINEESQAKTFYTTFQNFEAMGESGSPQFVAGQAGLATWINAPKEIAVGPGETKSVDFSVVVPTDAEPGGYFAAIFLSTTPPSANPNQLSIGARIGTLLLFRVNGDIQEGASLLEFNTKDKKKLFSSLPIDFYYRFQNTGADRIMPKGDLTITNIFGHDTEILNANAVQGNILPRSIRRFEISWQKNDNQGNPKTSNDAMGFWGSAKYQWNNFAFGYYKANINLIYGSQNEKVNAKTSIFVLPWQLLLIELVILALIVVILWFVIKRYNKFIIKRARRRS